ncbi:MAG: YHYH protein [Proteobacteria bacterium]|nr:YHYH protein [Pseudomonadota bacterium]MYJ95943.1 YHYH protein [Pseudomonadota bacterium]
MITEQIKRICGAVPCALLAPLVLLGCSGGSAPGDAYAQGAGDTQRPGDVPERRENVTTLSPAEHCAAVIASVVEAGFEDEARVTCHSDRALIHSDSYPSHEMMTGIVGTNEQIPLPAPGYNAPVHFNSAFTGTPQTRDSSLAIAVNGIPIFDYSAGGEMSVDDLYYHQPHVDTLLRQEIDHCGGHVGRGDDYHYHELPRCMIEQMDNRDENPIIAWGFDGFPMYGNDNPDGSPIAAGILDVCNGQLDPVFGYRYHTSEEPPYIIQCLVGEVGDLSAVPTIGINRPSGRPTLVEDLAFTHDGAGTGLLTYNYQGESYYIQSWPTDGESCFEVEWKTVTNGGVVESGEYCHVIRTGGGMGPPPGGGMGGPPGGGMGGAPGGGMGEPPGAGMGAP